MVGNGSGNETPIDYTSENEHVYDTKRISVPHCVFFAFLGFLGAFGAHKYTESANDKLAKNLKNAIDLINISYIDIGSNHSTLQDAIEQIFSCINDEDYVKKFFSSNDYYHCYISDGEEYYNDSIIFTITDDCFKIAFLSSQKEFLYKFYNNGSYSISCEYERDVEKLLENVNEANKEFDFSNESFYYNFLNKYHLHRITYNFSRKGVLTNSVVEGSSSSYDAKYEYIDGDINTYKFYTYDNQRGYTLFADTTEDLSFYDYSLSVDDRNNNMHSNFLSQTNYNYLDFDDIKYSFGQNYEIEKICAENDKGEILEVYKSSQKRKVL